MLEEVGKFNRKNSLYKRYEKTERIKMSDMGIIIAYN